MRFLNERIPFNLVPVMLALPPTAGGQLVRRAFDHSRSVEFTEAFCFCLLGFLQLLFNFFFLAAPLCLLALLVPLSEFLVSNFSFPAFFASSDPFQHFAARGRFTSCPLLVCVGFFSWPCQCSMQVTSLGGLHASLSSRTPLSPEAVPMMISHL